MNAAAHHDERNHRFGAIVGYSRKLFEQTGIVADLVREQQPLEGQVYNFAEVGIIRQLNEKTNITLGWGIGLGDDSPHYRLQLGLQVQL